MATIPVILLNGTTADANEVMADFLELYNNIDPSNVQPANKTGTGPFVLRDGATINTGFTQGSILFAGVGGVLDQDNASFFWDNSNNRIGIQTATPIYTADIRNAGVSLGNTLHLSSTTGDIGAYLETAPEGTQLNSGAFFDRDTGLYIAKETEAIVFQMSPGNNVAITFNSGLVVGAPFVPTTKVLFATTGEMLLPRLPAPGANFANGNSFIQVWGLVQTPGGPAGSAGGSNITFSASGVGFVDVTFPTPFASTNYAVFVGPGATGIANKLAGSIRITGAAAFTGSIVAIGVQ